MAIGWDGLQGVHRQVKAIHEGGIPTRVQIAAQLANVKLLHITVRNLHTAVAVQPWL